MKFYFVFMSLFYSLFSFANCEEFINQKIEQMNLGTLSSPSCGVMKSEDSKNIRVSMSKDKGRKDSGPTLSLYKDDPANIKVVQLLSKDNLTNFRQKYTYVMGTNCSEFKSVTYLLGTLQTEVTKEKCSRIKDHFVDAELVHLSVNMLCLEFFPTKENTMEAPRKVEAKAMQE